MRVRMTTSKHHIKEAFRECLFDIRLWGLANYLLLYSLLSLYSNDTSGTQEALTISLVDVIPSGYALPIIAFLMLSCLVPRLSRIKKPVPSTVCLLIGLAALSANIINSIPNMVLLIVALCCLAGGLVLSAAAWMESLASFKPSIIALIIIIAQALSASVQLPLSLALPELACILLVLMAIVVNGILLLVYRKRSQRAVDSMPSISKASESELHGTAQSAETVPPKRQSIGFRLLRVMIARLSSPLLLIGAVALSLAIIRTIAASRLGVDVWGYPIPAIGRLLGAAILGLIWLRGGAKPIRAVGKRRDWVMLALYAAIILEFVLYPFFGLHYSHLFLVFGHAAMTIAFITALEAGIKEVQLHVDCSIPVVCLIYSTMYIALALGILVVGNTSSNEGFDLTSLLFQALAVVVMLSLVLIIMAMAHSQKLDANKQADGSQKDSQDGSNNTKASDSRVESTVISYSEQEIRSNPHLTELYQLTQREIDVVVLLVGGRSVKHIAKPLFISENTVRDHMKNIYQKLGVHKKQELLDMVAELMQHDDGPTHHVR